MTYDLAIVGSGFGGSLLSMIARRLGLSVLLVERFQHPRFVIGESSTPLANLALEDLARRYDLGKVLPLAKWGTWQTTCTSVACGLKRGFTFFHHHPPNPWTDDSAHSRQLLVGASPKDRVADTHWYRPEVDRYLMEAAREMGVIYSDQTQLNQIGPSQGVVRIAGERLGAHFEALARWVVDATGPRGCLFRQLRLPEVRFEAMPATQALYSHFRGVTRWADAQESEEAPPYPVDDAAVHHLFPGGWIWVLRFNNGITSAGVAATDTLAKDLGLDQKEPAWQRLLDRLPSVRRLFESAEAVEPFYYSSRVAFRCGQGSGPWWVMLPSATGVVDPLLSTGFALNLLGIGRLARALEASWGKPDWEEALKVYSELTLGELDTTALLVGTLYELMDDFELFVAYSKLYFAAVSYSETAWRLGKPDLWAGQFLLKAHPTFGPAFAQCCAEGLRWARSGRNPVERMELLARVQATIGPVDVAGLTRKGARHWHPARAQDLLAAADRLRSAPEEIRGMLERCGLLAPGETIG